MLAAVIENARRLRRDLVERRDDDARQAVFALEPRHVVLEHVDVDDQAARACAERSRASWLRRRSIDGRRDDAKVLGAFRIRRDDEMRAVMFDAVLMPDAARRDETRRLVGLVGIDEIGLRSSRDRGCR